MWTPLITLVALTLLALIVAAGVVTLGPVDQHRGQRALTVLKVLIGATLGSSGVFAAIIRLYQVGLL
jgi:hypothetical protein